MKSIQVKEIMIQLEEYAVVSMNATLCEAVLALKEAQTRFERSEYLHRAVLVLDESGQVVGKLSQNDVLRGLEPKYEKIGNLSKISHWELSAEFIKSMMKNFSLWENPLENICRKATEIKVKDIMYTPAQGEFVDEDATLDEAIHKLVVGYHQSLLVTKEERVVGILRLTDVFSQVSKMIEACLL